MFEYHGWVSLRSTAEATDDEPALRLAEIRTAVDQLGDYALMDLQPMNGAYYLHMGGHPNHRGTQGDSVVALLRAIGEIAPGSYGLLYVHDDEDPDEERRNAFRVLRLVRGVVTDHADDLLSPVIPVLEDGYSLGDVVGKNGEAP